MGQWERVGHHHRFQAEMGLAYIRLPEDKQKQLVTDGGNINVEVKSVNYMAGYGSLDKYIITGDFELPILLSSNTQKTNKSPSKVIQ